MVDEDVALPQDREDVRLLPAFAAKRWVDRSGLERRGGKGWILEVRTVDPGQLEEILQREDAVHHVEIPVGGVELVHQPIPDVLRHGPIDHQAHDGAEGALGEGLPHG